MTSLLIQRHRLDNGLQVVLQPDSSLPLVAINLWYHVGSKNERAGRTGFAHLFEHMLFQGSEHVGTNDHFRFVQQVGGVANGSTWFDRTNYFETIPSHHLDLGLWLESDRMGFLLPGLTQEKLDTQRAVVINERRQRVDNQPYGRAMERLHELLYPADHPYHWPVIGYLEDLEAATLGEVEEFFRTYYVPNNSVLSLVGAFEPEEALEAVVRFFGDIPSGSELPKVETPPPAPSEERRETMEDKVHLARIYLAFSGPRFGEPDWYAGDLLSAVLSGGKSSPLYRDLVYSKQIAQDVSTWLLPLELSSTFMVIATAKPGVDPSDLEARLVDHLLESTQRPPTSEDLDRARNRVVTSHYEGLQGFEQRADLLSLYTTYFEDPARIESDLETYLQLAGQDLVDFGHRFLGTDQMVALHVVPEENGS